MIIFRISSTNLTVKLTLPGVYFEKGMNYNLFFLNKLMKKCHLCSFSRLVKLALSGVYFEKGMTDKFIFFYKKFTKHPYEKTSF